MPTHDGLTYDGVLTHRITVARPPHAVYDLVADPGQAARPAGGVVHAERVARHDGGDVIRRWVAEKGAIRSWTARRELDPDAGRIVFEHDPPKPPLSAMRGEWRFTEAGPGTTLVELRHDWAGPAPAERLDQGIRAQLDALKYLAERDADLTACEFLQGRIRIVPGRLEDVAGRPGRTLVDGAHARVWPAGDRLVWRQIGDLPPLYRSLRGQAVLTQVPGGVLVETRRIDVLDPDAVRDRGWDAARALRHVTETRNEHDIDPRRDFAAARPAEGALR
ncbi:aromatase/cyclase [Actinoallomurus sp. CA-150999]|uniref:aromatase/cyclase n=1 Tax=Actinoallomurus sp. CA-150999 TaxID=3239887 RepID=UPI003D8D3193